MPVDAEVGGDSVRLVRWVDAVAAKEAVESAASQVDLARVPSRDRSDDPDAVGPERRAHRRPEQEIGSPAADRLRERPAGGFQRAAGQDRRHDLDGRNPEDRARRLAAA